MGSISQRVTSVLDSDGVVQEALRRGIVNHRALARWIIDSRGWEATEEAVVSALRRHSNGSGESAIQSARPLFEDAHLSMRSQVCVLVLSKQGDLPRRLPRLFDTVDFLKGEALRLIQTDKSVTVIIDEVNLEDVEEILGQRMIERKVTNVAEIDVFTPEEALTTPGVLATVLEELAARRINVVEFVSGSPEALVFVDQEDGMDAYRALNQLIERAAQ